MTFKSSTEHAQNAILGFKKHSFSPTTVTISQSDVTSMRNGQNLANQIYQDASGLNDKVIQIAKAIPAYASKVEMDDLKDATQISGTLLGGVGLPFGGNNAR
ncbi:MAG: hypothetical protein LBI13_07815 [Streptococcaceae bacterium]|jgi:hypothetical protein|nr:hypothetical protein [Streptococcaceae bacterium]